MLPLFSSVQIGNALNGISQYKVDTGFYVENTKYQRLHYKHVESGEQVPKDWKLDPKWEAEERAHHQLSHHRRYPSKWRSASSPDPVRSVRVVDNFTIARTVAPDPETTC